MCRTVLICQLQGWKRVQLFSPACHDRMQPRAETFPALTAQERIGETLSSEELLRELDGLEVSRHTSIRELMRVPVRVLMRVPVRVCARL